MAMCDKFVIAWEYKFLLVPRVASLRHNASLLRFKWQYSNFIAKLFLDYSIIKRNESR